MLRSQMRGFATKPLTTSKFVQKELKENPEFFKAFPNLQRVFDPNPKMPNQEINRVMTK
jgi:hypothetical protein